MTTDFIEQIDEGLNQCQQVYLVELSMALAYNEGFKILESEYIKRKLNIIFLTHQTGMMFWKKEYLSDQIYSDQITNNNSKESESLDIFPAESEDLTILKKLRNLELKYKNVLEKTVDSESLKSDQVKEIKSTFLPRADRFVKTIDNIMITLISA